MYKKIIPLIILFSSAFLFSSCWIYPDYKDYEIIDGIYFFEDYETMKSVIIPMINKSFSAWHWNGDEFDSKYQKYNGNIAKNQDDLSVLSNSKYNFAVRNKLLASNLETSAGKPIRSEFYWITTKNDKAVVFYQN